MGAVERALLRRAGNYRIGRSISLNPEGHIVVSFNMPELAIRRRLVKEPEKHSLMRAFDKMFVDGNPKTGKIGAIMLYDPTRGGPRCLGSFAVTNFSRKKGILGGHRLVLFPSWIYRSNTIGFMGMDGRPTILDAHHITFEPKSDGTLNCHATRFNRKTPRHILCKALSAEDDRILLSQVFVQDHKSLDPVGLLTKTVKRPTNSEKTVKEWDDSLHFNFPEKHILMSPPDLMNTNDYEIVFCKIYLSKGKVEPRPDEKFPAVVFSKMPSKSISRQCRGAWYSIGIYPDLYLSILLSRMDGCLKSSIMWAFEEKEYGKVPEDDNP